MKKIFFFASALLTSLTLSAEVIKLDLSQPTNPESFEFNEAGMWTETWNGTDFTFFETQKFAFSHILSGESYEGTFWDGFTVSKATQDGEGYGYYSNVAKGGLAGVGTPYILAYYNEWWLMDDANEDMMSSNQILFGGEAYYPRYVYLNNALVSYMNILEGGGAARPFAKGDKFEVWIQGITEDLDDVTDEKVIYRLADFTSENEAEWFINTEWEKVDLSELGQVYGLAFTVVSTDQGTYGTNTATYFALDGLTVTTTADEPVNEPLEVADFENIELEEESVLHLDSTGFIESGSFLFQQEVDNSYGYALYYGNILTNKTDTAFASYLDAEKSACGGAYEGKNFITWTRSYTGMDNVYLKNANVVPGFFINNSVYAVNSMCHGDAYAKKFDKDDWFKLTINGLLNGTPVNTQVEVYLAIGGYYISQWTYVDLTPFGEVDALIFTLSSSDNGDWGMNTPAYFCMDNFGAEMPEDYVAPEMTEFPTEEGIADVEATAKAVKIVRDGQVLIVRDGKVFTVLGAEL